MKTNNEYAKLLATPEWKAKRDSVLKLHNYTCQRCGSQTKLHVHHTYYDLDKNPWEYDSESLLVLCKSCHYKEHLIEGKVKPLKKEGEETYTLPDFIRDAKCGSNGISSMSKYIYTLISGHKRDDNSNRSSYQYMYYKYGISNSTYRNCLQELCNAKAISVSHTKGRGIDNIDIEILYAISKDKNEIPRCLFDTDVYTNAHKSFICMLWNLFEIDSYGEDMYIGMSDNAIVKYLTPIGFSKTSVLKYLKELSVSGNGWVSLLNKEGFGYSLNFSAVLAIKDRVSNLNDKVKITSSIFKFHHYTKPKPHDFQLLEVDGKLTIVSNK